MVLSLSTFLVESWWWSMLAEFSSGIVRYLGEIEQMVFIRVPVYFVAEYNYAGAYGRSPGGDSVLKGTPFGLPTAANDSDDNENDNSQKIEYQICRCVSS